MNVDRFDSEQTNISNKHLVDISTTHRQSEALSKHPKSTPIGGLPKAKPKEKKIFFALVATIIGLLVLGQTNMSVRSAQSVEALEKIADSTRNFSDPVPAPGQYLQVRTHEKMMSKIVVKRYGMEELIIDVYVPGNANQHWVMDRDGGANQGKREVIHAPDAKFYDGSSWVSGGILDLDAMPRDGAALYKLIDESDYEEFVSQAENTYSHLVHLLKNSLLSADRRAVVYEALASVPGVTLTENQKTFDGRSGTAIGRTEALRMTEREEIIIDPDSGMVIGKRDIATVAAFGFGFNNVLGHTTISYNIVDSAPAALTDAQPALTD